MWPIVLKIGGWLWNNKLLALCLACLLIASTKLAVTSIALSTKARLVEKQAAQISELLIIQKEDRANIAALKAYNDQTREQKQRSERVVVYISELDQQTAEILNHEKVKARNHCLFGYFRDGVLPEGCDKADAAALSEAARKAK